MIEEDYLVTYKSIESVLQFYLSHEEYHLNALKVLSLMMLTPEKMIPNALFLLCSRITQAVRLSFNSPVIRILECFATLKGSTDDQAGHNRNHSGASQESSRKFPVHAGCINCQ
jgi:hypothetical protein